MKNKDQFDREIETREKNELNSKFVIGINHTYDGSTDETFLSALQQANLGEYKFTVVMLCADRNMEDWRAASAQGFPAGWCRRD
mmetsp:Transcript_21028/g.43862  ORF Transcript_21028/g.43862 Transcript_21028/m.43862 type:complete len:84 (-) Transcript_21028:84-335(-)